MKKEYHVSTVQRAIDVLNLFKTQKKISFTEMLDLLEYNKSTLFRVLYTLEQNRYLARDQHGLYGLGVNVFILGTMVSGSEMIKKISGSHLKTLCEQSGNTIHVGVLVGLDVVIIDKYEPLRGVKMVSRVGASVPPHCTGQGKVVLAYSPSELTRQIVEHHGLARHTPNTITTMAGLEDELKEIRKRGYAVDNAEHEQHIKCISVPIMNVDNKLEAALSITGLTLEFADERLVEQRINMLKTVKSQIEAELGRI